MLVSTVRVESPAALVAWFGVAKRTVGNWRRVLGVREPEPTPKPDPAAGRRKKLTAEAVRFGVPARSPVCRTPGCRRGRPCSGPTTMR